VWCPSWGSHLLDALKRPLRRWRYRGHVEAEAREVGREIWAVERELEEVVSGSAPLLLGPWTGEVGYEVLYWVPFLRWLAAAYRLAPDRMVAVSRGGAGAWYAGIAASSLDAFELMGLEEFAALSRRQAADRGTSKQHAPSALDDELVSRVAQRLGKRPRVVHPSLMFRLLRAFWSGQESMSFLERHVRMERLAAPQAADLSSLPREYVAVKFYSARSLPADPAMRASLRTLVSGMAARTPVVLLETDVRVDEHDDFTFDGIPNTYNARALMTPVTNLAVQTQIIAASRMFVGTCGSVAWLAPMLGVDTIAVFADASFLHAHLHVARRAFQKLSGAGAFSPCDIAAMTRLGFTVGS
jgi:hypothetical protein